MSATKKNIIDSLFEILTRFKRTDETRIDEDWLSYKIDSVRAELIIKQYAATGIIDQTWLSDLGDVAFHKTNYTDDPTIQVSCNIAKATIPQFVSLVSTDANNDLGIFSVTSLANSKQFYPKRMFSWRYTPSEHTNSLFNWYWRINTQLYVSDPNVTKLRIIGILLNPEDGYLNNTTPVLSGALANGTNYTVKGAQILYNGTVYSNNDTFTAGVVATFTGTGLVYLTSVASSYRDVDPYPASGEMIRNIELEILTKEFAIEKNQIADVRNDSVDDANKQPQI
jgi:hypothetical protein